MAVSISAQRLVQSEVGPTDRILLINPPVEDTRYAWLRWNQPTDLLKLSTLLKLQIGCEVELLDFMKPDRSGRVFTQRLPSVAKYRVVGDETYPMWRFGRPYDEFTKWVTRRRADKGPLPTQIWVTSLCSYWFAGVAQICREARKCLPEAKLVLVGNYARLLTEHACELSPADLVVTDSLPLTDHAVDLQLYGDELPPFVGIASPSPIAVSEIKYAVERGVYRFALFADDIAENDGQDLRAIIKQTENLHRHVRFHLICGLSPGAISTDIAECLARKSVAEFYFEEQTVDGALDLGSYEVALDRVRAAGRSVPSDSVSSFVWIGYPEESLDGIIGRAIDALRQVGAFILKPYTPTPNSDLANRYESYLSDKRHFELSPHLFPFAEMNGIGRDEYNDLYRLAAFLNERVRNRTFDLLDQSLGAHMLRESLQREVWHLEPSPLRIID